MARWPGGKGGRGEPVCWSCKLSCVCRRRHTGYWSHKSNCAFAPACYSRKSSCAHICVCCPATCATQFCMGRGPQVGNPEIGSHHHEETLSGWSLKVEPNFTEYHHQNQSMTYSYFSLSKFLSPFSHFHSALPFSSQCNYLFLFLVLFSTFSPWWKWRAECMCEVILLRCGRGFYGCERDSGWNMQMEIN